MCNSSLMCRQLLYILDDGEMCYTPDRFDDGSKCAMCPKP